MCFSFIGCFYYVQLPMHCWQTVSVVCIYLHTCCGWRLKYIQVFKTHHVIENRNIFPFSTKRAPTQRSVILWPKPKKKQCLWPELAYI